MIGEVLATLAIPTAALLAGRVLGARWGAPLPLPWRAIVGTIAPPAALAMLGRPFGEQLAAWAVAVVGWGGLLLGGDPSVFALCGLTGGIWAAISSLAVGASPPAPLAPQRSAAAPADPAVAATHGAEPPCISLTCPSCGAAVTVPVYHGMAQCSFCGSRHLVRREEGPFVTVIPNAIQDQAAVRGAVLAHLRYLKYLELYDRRVRPLLSKIGTLPPHHPQGLDTPFLDTLSLATVNAAEARVHRAADAYAARLAPQVKVLAWQPFLAPYWHCSGTLYQVAFGRHEDGTKGIEFAVTPIEGSQPASSVPLPEMGKLSYLKHLRPLYGAPEGKVPALAMESGREELVARLQAMEGRRASFSFRTIALRGVFVPRVEVLVWRPWHAVRVAVGFQEAEFLLDGGSGRVAAASCPTLPHLGGEAPPPPQHQVRLVPSRCPVCGADLPFAPEAVAHLCRNCLRLLDGAELRPRPYLREEGAGGHCSVPFWRFPLALRTAEGVLIRDLSHLGDFLDGVLDQVGHRPPQTSYLFVPAFRLRLTRSAVRFYRRLWPLLHGAPRALSATPFPPHAVPGDIWPLTLKAEEARVFGVMYLALSFTPRDLARVEVRGVRARLLETTLEGQPEPAYLSLPSGLVSPLWDLAISPEVPAVARLAGR